MSNVPVNLLADLGAKVSLLDKSVYQELCPSTRLFKADTTPTASQKFVVSVASSRRYKWDTGRTQLRFYVTLSVAAVSIFSTS